VNFVSRCAVFYSRMCSDNALKSAVFYRAMHYSAKRGIAIARRLPVRLSVRLSVTLVNQDHTGWISWKLIIYCTAN